MKLGKDLILALSGEPLAAAKSCSIQQSQSFIEVASPTSGRWKQVVPSMLEWGISANTLLGTYAAYNTLDQAWRNGTAVTIRYYDTEYNCNKTGTAYIADIRLEGSVGSLAQMSIQLQGSGELSKYAGTAITVTRTLQHTAMFYYNTTGKTYETANYSDSAKIYTGSFTLSKRTLVQISGMRTGNNSLVFLSTNNGIITKAQNAETIYGIDYNAVIKDSGRVWLNAGTWYVVESSQNYTTPTYTQIS